MDTRLRPGTERSVMLICAREGLQVAGGTRLVTYLEWAAALP
jgi:hypothetical protein